MGIDKSPSTGEEMVPIHQRPFQDKGSGIATHWQVLLCELVHLLGLFLYRSRHTREAKRIDVIFDQVIQHLKILIKMPGHDNGMLIRRMTCGFDPADGPSEYLALFGDVMIKGEPGPDKRSAKSSIESTLRKAFGYLAEMGIHAFYLQIPELSSDKIEQLRLCLNIVARFDHAADFGAALTIRYAGRAITFPVILDNSGRPDPNLTLMAAINGLTAVNARELVKQAAAYQTLQVAIDAAGQHAQYRASNEYNQIFSVRSLRSQILKPLIEINNMPWVRSSPVSSDIEAIVCGSRHLKGSASAPADNCADERVAAFNALSCRAEMKMPELNRKTIQAYFDVQGDTVPQAMDSLFEGDYCVLDPLGLAERIAGITRLLYAIDKKCQDPAVIDSILDYLRYRLLDVPDNVLSSIVAKRQGLKISISGRSILIGLVHPRLFDLIALVKERIDVKQRTAIIKKVGFDFNQCHLSALADGFQLSSTEALHILNMLKGCFGNNGAFIRPIFEKRVGAMAMHQNAIFEMLWCFLKLTPERKDRLDFLNAMQLLMVNLKDPKRALQFLLADVSRTPASVNFTDRNAFALANILLYAENRELYVDINRTPEDVLSEKRNVNERVKHYAAWRLEVDQIQFLCKTRTVRGFTEAALKAQAGEEAASQAIETQFLFALEREIFIFCAVVGGNTARIALREALDQYGHADSPLFQINLNTQYLSTIMAHLQVAVRAMGRAGHALDVGRLQALEKNAKALSSLDVHPAHKLHVQQTMKWVAKALRDIQI